MYNDLPHPPATYMGKNHQWRKADGSYNNVDIPDIGKANTPYARSVQQGHPLPANAMPDAGLLFDTLLRRESVSYFIFSISMGSDWESSSSHTLLVFLA